MKRLLVALLAVLSLSLAPPTVQALSALPATQMAVCGSGMSDFFGFQPWYACLPGGNTGNPKITKLTDVFLIIFPVVETLVKIAILVAAGVIFYMLIQMTMARGDAAKVKNSVEGIRDAVIGFVIALVAVAIVNFVAGAFY